MHLRIRFPTPAARIIELKLSFMACSFFKIKDEKSLVKLLKDGLNDDLSFGWIAQSVEQRTENPCVPGSIPGPATFQNATHPQLIRDK